MTTITTTQALNPSTTASTGVTARTWRYVASFLAGAMLASVAAVGVNAVVADDDPAPAVSNSTKATHTYSTASDDDLCPLRDGRIC